MVQSLKRSMPSQEFFFGFKRHGRPSRAEIWQSFVARALTEECVGYRLDAECGVHYLVDEQFARNRVATLAGLCKDRYAAARHAFKEGMAALDGVEPNTLPAVRGVFEANENVFKLMLGPNVLRLTEKEIDKHLRPIILTRYEGRSKEAARKMLSSFGDWVDGMHFYRHAPGSPEPSPPPIDLAVAIIDSGAAFLRWLIEIDSRVSG